MNPSVRPPTTGIQLDTSVPKLVVGDVHGCYDELRALIELAGCSESDRIVAVGDLVDRGNQPWEVVEFFRSRLESRFAVCGNHEWKHLLHADNPVMPNRLGNLTRGQMGPERYALALDYFRRMPLWIELPEVLVVHAGVAPGLSLAEMDPKLVMGVASNTRAGFDGESPWWFDDPGLQLDKPVAFGHHVFPTVARGERGNVWGINTGAGYGLPLTGLRLPDFKLFSVPTKDTLSALPPRWATPEEQHQLAFLPWNELFKLLACNEALPPAAAAIAEAARDHLESVAQRIAETGKALRDHYGIDALPPAERGQVLSRLWRSETFATPYGQCVLQAVKGHPVLDALRKHFPTPHELRRAEIEGPVSPTIPTTNAGRRMPI